MPAPQAGMPRNRQGDGRHERLLTRAALMARDCVLTRAAPIALAGAERSGTMVRYYNPV